MSDKRNPFSLRAAMAAAVGLTAATFGLAPSQAQTSGAAPDTITSPFASEKVANCLTNIQQGVNATLSPDGIPSAESDGLYCTHADPKDKLQHGTDALIVSQVLGVDGSHPGDMEKIDPLANVRFERTYTDVWTPKLGEDGKPLISDRGDMSRSASIYSETVRLEDGLHKGEVFHDSSVSFISDGTRYDAQLDKNGRAFCKFAKSGELSKNYPDAVIAWSANAQSGKLMKIADMPEKARTMLGQLSADALALQPALPEEKTPAAKHAKIISPLSKRSASLAP